MLLSRQTKTNEQISRRAEDSFLAAERRDKLAARRVRRAAKAGKIAVLDDNTRAGMVLGWAGSHAEALGIAATAQTERNPDYNVGSVSLQSARLSYDPDIHTAREVETVNAQGRAWIVEWVEA